MIKSPNWQWYIAGIACALLLLSTIPQVNAQTLPTDKFVWEGKVRVVVASPSETRRNCDTSNRRTVHGCYRLQGDTHVLYTSFRHSHESTDKYHETLGHELDHGIRGDFHGKP